MAAKAKESPQILKARKKIKKQLAAANKRINQEALTKMSKLIQEQLSRRKSDRINLKKRQITLFDENKHSAKTQSKFIRRLVQHLKHPLVSKENQLEGRIKSMHDEK